MINRKIILLLAVMLILSLAGGCGYHMGSIMHPQVKSIAVAPVKNETMEPLASAYVRQALSEQFQLDGSLKVKSLDEADCIIYSKITEVENSGTAEDSTDAEITYRASEWSIAVTIEFVVIIPGRSKPLVNKRTVSDSAIYQVGADHFIMKKRGLQQACRNAAQKVVIYTVEAW